MVLVTSAKLVADRTESEVGGRFVPTATDPSLLETEDIEPPLELDKDLWDGRSFWPATQKKEDEMMHFEV